MCSPSVLNFVGQALTSSDVKGHTVLEVGARDVNGSARPLIEALGPAAYVGADIQMGPGVDVVCDARGLIARFGAGAFGLVVCTEVLEHVRDWRAVVHNLKQVVKPHGVLLVTTRSYGVDFHRHPFDYWRYEIADVETMFSDFALDILVKDPVDPGVFLKARKPSSFVERDPSTHRLYSILRRRRRRQATTADLALFHLRYRAIRLYMDCLPRHRRRPVHEHLLR